MGSSDVVGSAYKRSMAYFWSSENFMPSATLKTRMCSVIPSEVPMLPPETMIGGP